MATTAGVSPTPAVFYENKICIFNINIHQGETSEVSKTSTVMTVGVSLTPTVFYDNNIRIFNINLH